MAPALAPMLPAPPVVVREPISQVCQNYHANCEASINHRIRLELHASYVYLSIAFYFDRPDQAWKHFATFAWPSREEWEHAQAWMRLRDQRGGCIRVRDIRGPDDSQWESSLKAVKSALPVARMVNQSLRNPHHLAAKKNDPTCSIF
ncbi:ferritin heavy chain-like [Myotis daubentonii]|uniref:ferritin heavy chain-like n=1 Tax=Myotis daubentonii TaxID=98922 RepID=UPI002873ABA2|nr:ferritin heavy chain-like [Myotis daubentonii]